MALCNCKTCAGLAKVLLALLGAVLIIAQLLVPLLPVHPVGVWRRFFGIRLESPVTTCPSREPEFNLAMMSIFKDAKPYLKEWIEFHLLTGFQHFFLYDNESEDNPETVLDSYVWRNIVTIRRFPTQYQPGASGKIENYSQKAALVDALSRYRCRAKWLALLDIDEYLFSPSMQPLPNVLQQYSAYGGVSLTWLHFGTNHHALPPSQLTIEAYTRRTDRMTYTWKNIVQPTRVIGIRDVHEMIFCGGYYSVDERHRVRSGFTNANVDHPYGVFRLHHYFTRSAGDWLRRVRLGAVSGPSQRYGSADLRRFEHMNAVLDTSALPYARQLRERLAWNGTQ